MSKSEALANRPDPGFRRLRNAIDDIIGEISLAELPSEIEDEANRVLALLQDLDARLEDA